MKNKTRSLSAPIPKNVCQISRRHESTPSTMPYYHYHNAYEIYYLRSGERYYFIKNKSYHVTPGSLVLIDSYDIHYTAAYGDAPYERILLTFSPDYLGELTSHLGAGDPLSCFKADSPILPLEGDERRYVEELLEQMLCEAGDGAELRLRVFLLSLLLLAEKHHSHIAADIPSRLGATRRLISEITAFVNYRYRDELTLSTVAEHFFISPCYLSRIFGRMTGISFTEYVNSVRIKEAEKLLMHTALDISEIGERVGFRSSTHFGRIFKQHSGLSPREYRNAVNQASL